VDEGILMVAAKVPPGLMAAVTAGMPANSSVCTNALDSSRTLVAQADSAGAGPTDPDTTTVSPAVIELGLTWRVVAGAAHAGAAGASMPTVAANLVSRLTASMSKYSWTRSIL
jgi:hypothetical protein